MNLLHRLGLPFWAIVIAIVLWIQVHGQGMGSVRMDVALQVRGVPSDMVIVNDLPDQVSITIAGLRAQLNTLDTKTLFVSVDASGLTLPGVVEQALDIETIDLPSGLKIEKIQPDSVQLQVDHVVKRTIEIIPTFDLPQGWVAQQVIVTPAVVALSGPEVWLNTLNKIETTALRLKLAQGAFDVETEIVPLSGKGIHVLNKDLKIRVSGDLVWTPVTEAKQPDVITDQTSDDYGKVKVTEQISIVPKPIIDENVKIVPKVTFTPEKTTKLDVNQVQSTLEKDVYSDVQLQVPEQNQSLPTLPKLKDDDGQTQQLKKSQGAI